MFKLLLFCFFLLSQMSSHKALSQSLATGSKPFLESNLLAEIATLKLKQKNFKVEHKKSMGGTAILWRALEKGDLDFYPEYTGTVQEIILGSKKSLSNLTMRQMLAKKKIGISDSLGFDNSYALAIKRSRATELSISKISDLQKNTKLRFAFTHEFVNRKDGWQGLKGFYGLSPEKIQTIEHSLAFESINSNKADLIDVNTTDPQIKKFDLLILKDDKNFFPKYEAVFLYRLDLPAAALGSLKELEGKINQSKIAELNSIASQNKSTGKAARRFLGMTPRSQESLLNNLWRWSCQHLLLVGISLALAIVAGIPLGIIAYSNKFLADLIIGFAGIVQTIPSLALLALFVPLLGIKFETAILALFLYSLLPIIKNTFVALQSISLPIKESASALGLSNYSQFRRIFLPLSSKTIIAGIRTSAVINIGTATLAALVGQGGLGEPIMSGLYTNDNSLILQGAFLASLMALLAQVVFSFLEKLLVPKGLLIQEKNMQKN